VTPPNALLLDLNGTLLDESGSFDAIRKVCAALAQAQPTLDAAQLLTTNGDVWRRYWPEVEERWTLGLIDDESVGLEAWRRTLRACGRDDDGLIRLARETHVRARREALRLFADARDMFDVLPQHIALGLVTNGSSETQREALRVLGIEQWFTAIIVAGEVHVAKPDARAFTLAVDKLGIRPDEAWYIGDSLLTDVGGAKAASLTAVWLNREGSLRHDGDPAPDLEIASLRELVSLLRPSASGAA
jgi:putative hydrolase of the HAD superfamily